MITSVRNPRVADAVKLKKRAFREREREFLVEGLQAVGEAVGTGPGLTTLFVSSLDGNEPVVRRAEQAGTTTIQGSGISEAITGSTDTIKTSTNSTTAFQIQNTSAGVLLNADTTNTGVTINGTKALGSFAVSPSTYTTGTIIRVSGGR